MLRLTRSTRSEHAGVNSTPVIRQRLNVALSLVAATFALGFLMNLAVSLGLPTLVSGALLVAVLVAFATLLVTLIEHHVHRVIADAQARRVTEHLKASGLDLAGIAQTPVLHDAGEDAFSELEALAASARPRHGAGE